LSLAREKASKERQTTITGKDIICALSELGFDLYAVVLEIYLQRWKVSILYKQDTKSYILKLTLESDGQGDRKANGVGRGK